MGTFKMCEPPSSSTNTMLVISLLLVLMPMPSRVSSLDITKLLAQYPAYSTFSNYLTQTQLASEINTKRNITVLAVDKSGMAPISGKPMEVIKKVLSIHVILDYFDVQRFQHLGNQTITVTTLFQASGQAHGTEGFVKVTDLGTGAVTFVSVSNQNEAGANLIKAVVAQPYTVSVVQVSTIIAPHSLLASSDAPSPPPAMSPVPVPVVSPVPVPTPVAVPVPVPVVTPVPVPVKPPAPAPAPAPSVSPVPVAAPVPVPVASPVPVATPVAVPVPVPVAVPVPVLSPASDQGASGAPADSTPSSDGGNNSNGDDGGPNSGVAKFDVNRALPLFLAFSSIYALSSLYNTC